MNRLILCLFINLLLIISACCDDNGDCFYTNTPPFISIQFDTSSIGFTNDEIDNSFVLIINDSSQTEIGRILPETSPSGSISINISSINEEARDRDIRNQTYQIHIANQIDTIHNINYEIIETIVECQQPCAIIGEKFEVTNQEFQNFSYNFNENERIDYQIIITK